MIKNYIAFHVNYPLFLSHFNKTSYFHQVAWKSVQRQPFVPCGRTDGQDETSSRFSQFCEGD